MGREGIGREARTGPSTQFLRELRSALDEAADRGQSPGQIKDKFRVLVEGESGRGGHREFLQDAGIYVAGYIYLDPRTWDVEKLLFGPSTPESLNFGTHYVWPGAGVEGVADEDRAATLVDTAFRLWRETDSLANSRRSPECFTHLPRGRGVDTAPERGVWSPGGVGCLHVPLGEIKFFTHAWRSVCRAAQHHGWDAPADRLRRSSKPTARYDWIWSRELWQERSERARRNHQESREWLLAKFLHEPGASEIEFPEPLRIAGDFERLEREHLCCPTQAPWIDDLLALGLVLVAGDHGWQPTDAALSLVAFMERVFEAKTPRISERLKRLNETAAGSLSLDELAEWDEALKETTLDLLGGDRASPGGSPGRNPCLCTLPCVPVLLLVRRSPHGEGAHGCACVAHGDRACGGVSAR